MQKIKTNFMASMIFILLAIVSIHANAASPQHAKAPSRAVVSPDNISPVVLLEGSLPVTWTNDDTYPWGVNTSEKSIYNGNHGVKNSVSWISFSYNSSYQTEVSFSWRNGYSSYHTLQLYIDGVQTASTTNGYNNLRYYLPRGSHVISFRDSIGNQIYDYQWSDIKNIRVTEIKSLETVVLADGSKPLVFKNDETWPWVTMSGYIQNSNYGKQNTSSRFSTTFTIDKPSVFKYDYQVTSYNNNPSGYHRLYTTIDNKTDNDYATGQKKTWSWDYTSGYQLFTRVLDPGTYTIEWMDTIFNTSEYPSQIKNVMLHDNWIDIELATPGTLGVEVLYRVNVLTDVELLKVKGTINSTDWADIKKMTNLKGIDLSEARFESVPGNAFSNNSRLNYCILPNGVKSIGYQAFKGSSLTKIIIPASVTSIGDEAFYQVSTLDKLTFVSGSQLESIGYRAFYECTGLREFIMPNTVKQFGTDSNGNSYAFYRCSKLQTIHFSDALTTIPKYICCRCTSLKDVHLPINLVNINNYAFYGENDRIPIKKIDFPASLRSIGISAFDFCDLDSVKLPVKLTSLGQWAFSSNHYLKYVELPSYIGNYERNFAYCPALQKVVCRSATPPAITNDPFSNGRAKSEVTLVVPSFAVATYKLDSYWYQFGNIIEGDDVDYWRITGPLMLTNNRRMDGKPDIDLYYGGQLTVGGNAPMPVGQMNYYAGQSGYGRLLNTCPNMTIENLTSYYSANNETWYFLTPIHDVDLTKVKHNDTSASFVFRYYNAANRAENGTGNSWQNVNNGKLEAGKGYIFRTNKSGTMTLPADAAGIAIFVNINDVTTNLETHNSSNSANKNWNYVGNPYPCYYDIYYMDFTAPIQVWTGSTYKAYSIADDKLALAPMQSFFVQKPDAISKIVFHKEGRQVESTPNHANMAPRYAPSQNSDRKLFDFAISTDTIADETRVVLNEKASLAYEIERDAAKFLSMESEVPQLYTIDYDQTMLAINERPMSDSIVSLGVYIGKPGAYTIDASRCPGEVELIDQVAKTTTNLNEESYTFEIDQTGFINDRFVLKFKNSSSSVIETKVNNTIEFHPVTGGVDIESSISTWANVYTIDGRLVANVKCSTGITHVALPAGIYMVQVGKNAIKTIVQ